MRSRPARFKRHLPARRRRPRPRKVRSVHPKRPRPSRCTSDFSLPTKEHRPRWPGASMHLRSGSVAYERVPESDRGARRRRATAQRGRPAAQVARDAPAGPLAKDRLDRIGLRARRPVQPEDDAARKPLGGVQLVRLDEGAVVVRRSIVPRSTAARSCPRAPPGEGRRPSPRLEPRVKDRASERSVRGLIPMSSSRTRWSSPKTSKRSTRRRNATVNRRN